jgi:hypothetical protein
MDHIDKTKAVLLVFLFLILFFILYFNVFSHRDLKEFSSVIVGSSKKSQDEESDISLKASNSSIFINQNVSAPPLLQNPATILHSLVDGSWRWGKDAEPFLSKGGGGSPPCEAYGYHQGCCVNFQNCVDFSGAFVLHDGSILQGLSELSPLLPSSARMLILGDSLSAYLRQSLVCLASREGQGSSEHRRVARQLEFANFFLPTGAVLAGTRQSQTCEILMAEEHIKTNSFEEYFNGFNVIVLNFGAWYHEKSELERCLTHVLPILARINMLPGKAAVFLNGWPSHFPILDGQWSEKYSSTHQYNCASARGSGNGGCLSVSTVEILAAQGFGASARMRGPTNFVGGCVPNANDVQSGWEGVISTAANRAGVPLVDISRIVGPLYSQHLQKFEVFDCSHICFATDVFAPVWDAITRSLLIAAAQSTSADNTSSSLRKVVSKGDSSSSLIIPLHLDFSSVCPTRSPLFAPRGSVFDRPHRSPELNVELIGGLKELRCGLLCSSTSNINDWASSHEILISFNVSPCLKDDRNVTVIIFADVYYEDLEYDMTQWNTSYPPRYGTETVYVGQTLIQKCIGSGNSWVFPLAVHGAWMVASAQAGDSLNLRIVACESSRQAGQRDGGMRLCDIKGALGCDIFPLLKINSKLSKTSECSCMQ